MPLEIGFIETVNIREVWPTENAAFTPWLQSHIGRTFSLQAVLGWRSRRTVYCEPAIFSWKNVGAVYLTMSAVRPAVD